MPKFKKQKKIYESTNLEEQYRYIMQHFDFDKVHDLMNWDRSYREYNDNGITTSQWKIYNNGEYKVPTVGILKILAIELLKKVMEKYTENKKPLYSYRRGPFKAVCRYGILELDCVIESWSWD